MQKTALLACVGSMLIQSTEAASATIAIPVAAWSASATEPQDSTPAPVEPVAAPPRPGGPTVEQHLAPEGVPSSNRSVFEDSSPWEKCSFTLGGMLSVVDSDVRFGVKGVGIDVNFEDLLGLDSSTTSYRLNGSWRFSDNLRHRVDVTWMDLGRSGQLTTQQDVDIGNGTVIPAGTGVKTGFQMNLIRTDYSYSFLPDERVDLAATFGLYVAPMEASLETSTGSGVQRNFDVTAPLPLTGLRMDVALTPKWFLRSSLSLFYLEISSFTGSMTDLALAVEYRAGSTSRSARASTLSASELSRTARQASPGQLAGRSGLRLHRRDVVRQRPLVAAT